MDVADRADQPTPSEEGTMALHSDDQQEPEQSRESGQLRDVAGTHPGAAVVVGEEPVTEPTIRVPVPAPGWIVIVAGTNTRASAAELPRAAFRDPALTRLLAVLDKEMADADG